MVFVPGELPVGEIVPITIDGAMVYDLTGHPAGYSNHEETTVALRAVEIQ
jgi:hypothetical protein